MIDAHAHLDDQKYDADRSEILSNLKSDGVDYLINAASDIESSKSSIALSKKYENIYATVGIHPQEVAQFDENSIASLRELAKEPKVVAIGEIGLDYYYDDCAPHDLQKEVFKEQLMLAKELDLPVVIHSRDAHKDTFDILKEYSQLNPGAKILLHCYSGSVELMREYMKIGASISLGGVTTFKNGRVAKEVAKEIPKDRLLLETDSPYLTPEPFRGKRNQPKYIRYTCEKIAKLRGLDTKTVENFTDENAKRFYNIGDKND
ncbi:MAG: TatD family hydrolase [Tissierellia bacterium]|nr:TatD family hydrolase [Tissierellia bacterium]